MGGKALRSTGQQEFLALSPISAEDDYYETQTYTTCYSKREHNPFKLVLLWFLRRLHHAANLSISILAAALATSAAFGLAETPQKPAAKKPAHAAKATPAAAKEPATRRASSHSGKAHKAAVKTTSKKGQPHAVVASKETEPVARSSRKSKRVASSHLSRRQLRRLNAMANEPAHFERASMGREGFFMPPLKGSYESLVRQNTKSEDEGLERIQDDDDLNDRIAQGFLVAVPVSSALMVNPSLPRRIAAPAAPGRPVSSPILPNTPVSLAVKIRPQAAGPNARRGTIQASIPPGRRGSGRTMQER